MNLQAQPAYTIISWSEFKEKFSVRFQMPFQSYQEEMAEIRLYEADAEGNVRFAEDLMVDCDMNVVIHGNLIIDGNLQMDCEGNGNFMYVSGNIEANSIVLSDVSTLSVRGNIKSLHGILGCYGEDGGFLNVGGKIFTPVIFNTTYFNMILTDYSDVVVIDTSYGKLNTEYNQATEENEEKIVAIVHPDVMENEYEFDIHLIWKALQTGKPVLKPGQ